MKSKGKSQKSKGKSENLVFSSLIFDFCPLPFSF